MVVCFPVRFATAVSGLRFHAFPRHTHGAAGKAVRCRLAVAALLGVSQILTRTLFFIIIYFFIYVCVHVWLEALPPHRPVVVVVAVRHAPNIPANEKRGTTQQAAPAERESFNVIKNRPPERKKVLASRRRKKKFLQGNITSTKQPGDIPIMALDVYSIPIRQKGNTPTPPPPCTKKVCSPPFFPFPGPIS